MTTIGLNDRRRRPGELKVGQRFSYPGENDGPFELVREPGSEDDRGQITLIVTDDEGHTRALPIPAAGPVFLAEPTDGTAQEVGEG